MPPTKPLGQMEFTILMAALSALVAPAIDAMLPALPLIAVDLGVQRVNDSQFVIGVFFLGMAFGQMLFGPMSDSIGRRPAILLGMGLFAAGCLLSIFAASFEQMLLGRLLQGVGAAGPRIVSIALVRDQFKGREMARIMSFVMTIFILVPVFAPALGQLMLNLAGWRSIFVGFLLLVTMTAAWFWLRQPETLPRERRIPFSFGQVLADVSARC